MKQSFEMPTYAARIPAIADALVEARSAGCMVSEYTRADTIVQVEATFGGHGDVEALADLCGELNVPYDQYVESEDERAVPCTNVYRPDEAPGVTRRNAGLIHHWETALDARDARALKALLDGKTITTMQRKNLEIVAESGAFQDLAGYLTQIGADGLEKLKTLSQVEASA